MRLRADCADADDGVSVLRSLVRLIRTKSDTGIVAVLDNRIVTKTYRGAFLRAPPKCPVEIL